MLLERLTTLDSDSPEAHEMRVMLLKKGIQDHGWTQSDLARAAGVSRQYIWSIVNGAHKGVPGQVWTRIFAALGKSVGRGEWKARVFSDEWHYKEEGPVRRFRGGAYRQSIEDPARSEMRWCPHPHPREYQAQACARQMALELRAQA